MKKIGTWSKKDIENVSPYHMLFLVVAVSYVIFFKLRKNDGWGSLACCSLWGHRVGHD